MTSRCDKYDKDGNNRCDSVTESLVEIVFIVYIQVKNSRQPSGHYTIDPNMGSAKDAIKSYCDFGGKVAKTCIKVSSSVC